MKPETFSKVKTKNSQRIPQESFLMRTHHFDYIFKTDE